MHTFLASAAFHSLTSYVVSAILYFRRTRAPDNTVEILDTENASIDTGMGIPMLNYVGLCTLCAYFGIGLPLV